jgi:hypothetical protein
MVNDSNLSIESIKYIDQFRYIIISTQAVYLYDLRFSQLQISEFPFNINYKSMNIKTPIVRDQFTDHNYFIGVDLSKKDISHILFDICEVTKHDFYNNFSNVNLIKSSSTIEDVAGILVDDTYINFTVDNFSTVSCTVTNLININNPNTPGFTKINSRFIDDGIEPVDEGEKKANLFKQNYHDYIYEKESEHEKLTYNNLVEEEVDSVESASLESDDERVNDEVDYGYAKIKGKMKKLFDIKNNRALVEKLLDKNIDVNMSEESEGSLIAESNTELNETLKQILENFKL